MKTGLLDPGFRYIPAASHEADPQAFRRRQRERRRRAQAMAHEALKNVQPIALAKKQAK
jgi:hypothetical protein